LLSRSLSGSTAASGGREAPGSGRTACAASGRTASGRGASTRSAAGVQPDQATSDPPARATVGSFMSRVPFPDRSLPNGQAPHQSLTSISIIGRQRRMFRLCRSPCAETAQESVAGTVARGCGCSGATDAPGGCKPQRPVRVTVPRRSSTTAGGESAGWPGRPCG
jgi:hypothetical protein